MAGTTRSVQLEDLFKSGAGVGECQLLKHLAQKQTVAKTTLSGSPLATQPSHACRFKRLRKRTLVRCLMKFTQANVSNQS